MLIPEKTSIEVLLDIVRGMREGANNKTKEPPRTSLWYLFYKQTLESLSNNKDFINEYEKQSGEEFPSPPSVLEEDERWSRRSSALWTIPYRDVECVLNDTLLIRSLETAGLGDLVDYLCALNQLNDLEEVICAAEDSFRKDGFANITIDKALDARDTLQRHLYDALTEELVESIYTRINRLPVGYPAEAILPNRSEVKPKPTPERIRKDREIIRIGINQLDIETDSTRISEDVGIYQRENGMLYVRVMIDGKLIRRSLGTKKTQEALLKTESVIKAALEDRESKELPKLAVFVDRYKEYSKNVHKETTYEKSHSRISTLVENLGSMRLDKISKQAVKGYLNKRVQTVSPASVNRELSLLSSIMEYALELDLIQENPVKKIKKLKESPGRERYLNGEELKRLLETCHDLSKRKGVGHNPILYEIVLTAILTGLRKGNLQNLKWSQVDLETGNIVIPASEHKTRKPLYFPLTPHLQEVLLGLRNSYPHSEYVFSKPDGTSYGDWKRSFENACTIAGLKNFHFHDLRHTHATFLNMLGANEYTIRALMGHQTLAASKRYVHTPPELVKEASEKLGEYVKQILRPKDETGN